MTETVPGLEGIQVLVVEDEAVLCMILREFLEELGCAIVGPASTVADALALAQDATIDVGLIDVNLHRQEAFPVADVLATRGIPFIFMSGDDELARKDGYSARPVLQKPFPMREVPALIQSVLNAAR